MSSSTASSPPLADLLDDLCDLLAIRASSGVRAGPMPGRARSSSAHPLHDRVDLAPPSACAPPGWRSAGPCRSRSPRRRCRLFSASVLPVAVRSTMPSTRPVSGASSTEPFTSTISAWRPVAGEVARRPRAGTWWRSGRGRGGAGRRRSGRRASGAATTISHCAVAEVEQLVDLALRLLEQHVLAGDADVGRAVLHVGRHVARAHGHDADVGEQQLAVVRAHLGGVDPEPVEQVERAVEERAARNRDGERSVAHAERLLGRLREVHALHVERQPARRAGRGRSGRSGRRSARRRRARSPRPGRRPRTPRPCSSRARARGRGRRSPGRPRRAASSCSWSSRRPSTPGAPGRRPSSTSRPAAELRAAARAGRARARPGRARPPGARAPRGRAARALSSIGRCALLRHAERAQQACGTARRRRPRPGAAAARPRRAPRSSSATTSASPSAPGHADQLDARLEELARLPHPALGGAPGAGEVARSAAAARRSRSGWPPRARSGSSCPSAAPARRPARRRSGSARRRRARRRAAAPPRTRARACGSRRSRRARSLAHAVADRAQLAHLLRQHVAGAGRDGRADRGCPCGPMPSRRSRRARARRRRARCARRAAAAARRSARSRGRSGGCSRSPTCRRRTAPR